jgi:hypothetical protein
MNEDAVKHLMLQAKHEILRLRHDNEILSAKVEVMDLFGLVLNTKPNYHGEIATPDVAWEIDRALSQFEEANTGMEQSAERGLPSNGRRGRDL